VSQHFQFRRTWLLKRTGQAGGSIKFWPRDFNSMGKMDFSEAIQRNFRVSEQIERRMVKLSSVTMRVSAGPGGALEASISPRQCSESRNPLQLPNSRRAGRTFRYRYPAGIFPHCGVRYAL
jgi:hypothetical protein